MDWTIDWIMDSILDLILDWKAESTNLTFPGLLTVHFLITCSLVPKVVIIQIPMDVFSIYVSI